MESHHSLPQRPVTPRRTKPCHISPLRRQRLGLDRMRLELMLEEQVQLGGKCREIRNRRQKQPPKRRPRRN